MDELYGSSPMRCPVDELKTHTEYVTQIQSSLKHSNNNLADFNGNPTMTGDDDPTHVTHCVYSGDGDGDGDNTGTVQYPKIKFVQLSNRWAVHIDFFQSELWWRCALLLLCTMAESTSTWEYLNSWILWFLWFHPLTCSGATRLTTKSNASGSIVSPSMSHVTSHSFHFIVIFGGI